MSISFNSCEEAQKTFLNSIKFVLFNVNSYTHNVYTCITTLNETLCDSSHKAFDKAMDAANLVNAASSEYMSQHCTILENTVFLANNTPLIFSSTVGLSVGAGVTLLEAHLREGPPLFQYGVTSGISACVGTFVGLCLKDRIATECAILAGGVLAYVSMSLLNSTVNRLRARQ